MTADYREPRDDKVDPLESPLPVFLRSAVRTPYGAFGGAFRRVGAHQLAVWAIQEALDKAGMSPQSMDALILGQALRYGCGADPGRQAAQAAGLACEAWVVDQGSASGLRAAASGLHAIEAGAYSRVLVAAADSASTVPYLLPAGRWGHRLGQAVAMDPLLLDAPGHEEEYQEAMARRQTGLGMSKELLIDWMARSHEKARTGAAECFPVTVSGRKGPVRIPTDEHLQSKPVLETGWPFPPRADAAAALVLCGEGPGVRIVGFRESRADHPTEAVLGAARSLLQDAGLGPGDLDQVEVDETLILSPLALIKALQGLDPTRVNVHGGTFATGHAHGTEGLRLLVSLFHGLEERKGRFGLAAMETANGLGLAMLLERTPA